MPAPGPVVTRRAALVAAAGVVAVPLVSGCTTGPDVPAPSGSSSRPAPTADDLARAAAADRERSLEAMAASLADAAGTPVAVAAVARVAQSAHLAHVDALVPGSSTGSPSGSATPGAATATPPPAAVTIAAVTVTALTRAEALAAAAHQAALVPLSGPLARLLASVAASDTALAAQLRAVR